MYVKCIGNCPNCMVTGKRLTEAQKCLAAPLDHPSTSYSPGSGSSGSQDSANEQGQRCPLQLTRCPEGYEVHAPTSSGKELVTGQVTATVYGALYQNGALMGLLCSVSTLAKSTPMGPEIPESLRPTYLQLTIPHQPWIDRSPFPRMRDNMITLLSTIDEEDFLADLFCLTSFTIESGAPSWDPRAWKVGEEFSAKWSYLFY